VAEELARSVEQLFDRDTFPLAPLPLANPKAARNQLSVFLLVLPSIWSEIHRHAILGVSGGQGPAEMTGAGSDPEGPVEIQLSLRLSVSQPITNRLHYSHSDFN